MVDHRRELVRERVHRVDAHVRRLVRLAVAEEVDDDHAVPARRDLRGEPVVHAPVHQQPVNEDEHTISLTVDLVLDPVAVIAERPLVGHGGGPVYSTLTGADAGSPAARCHGREARSALRTARVPGARLSA